MSNLFDSKLFPREETEEEEEEASKPADQNVSTATEDEEKESEPHPLEVFFKELDIKDDDKREDVINKILTKLNLTTEQLCVGISDYLKAHAEELTLEMLNIAPYGEYDSLIEDEDNMADFLKKESVKFENWELESIAPVGMDTSLIKFMFHNKSVDEGEVLRGFAIASLSGKIRHCFANVDV
jgi:hypothetical protein